MPIPVDITDPNLAKAYAHPLRVQILGLLEDRVATPRQLAKELGAPLANTSYHVRQLVSLGLVELVGRRGVRGAIEHHYTSRIRPTIWDEAWAKLPVVVKRSLIGGGVQETIRELSSAAEGGAFDREDFHFTRTMGRLDDQAWREISGDLARMLKRFEKVVAASEARLAKDARAEARDGMVVLMHFERAPRRAPRRATRKAKAKAQAGFEPDLIER